MMRIRKRYVWRSTYLIGTLCLFWPSAGGTAAPPAKGGSPDSPQTTLQYPRTTDSSSAQIALRNGELDLEGLVREVLARNPSVAQMQAAWQAASARYPQSRSLEDPTFAGTIGPGTISPDDRGVEFAYRIEVSQKLPYPGKRQLRGDNAMAEASAAGHNVDDVRLQLVESTKMAFADYYLADRQLAVNEESLRLLDEFRQNAKSRYQTGLAPEQDVLQADVEIGRERDRRLGLEESRQVVMAKLNTLLHQPTRLRLPPAPPRLATNNGLPEVETLQSTALARRPDILALQDRIAAAQASLALACKDFHPDFEPFFMYDRFMGNVSDNRDLAAMVGVRLNLPVYRAKRQAAVQEAQARIAERRAELAAQTDQVNFQVHEAYEKIVRSQRSVELYRESILKAAEANVKAAQAAYITGKIPLTSLIEAERSLVTLRDTYHQATAALFRRHATLERVSGGALIRQD
jgi:outer membrane protein TolC